MHETCAFKLPNDGRVAVIEILRTGFDENGQPIRLTVTVFPADRNKFVINVGQVPDKRTRLRSVSEATEAASGG